jgi:hypothetical protein
VGFRSLPFTTFPSAISYDTTQAAGCPILARSMRQGGIPLLRAAWDFRLYRYDFPRAISYNTILAATPAFNDSTCAACGMAISSSALAIQSRGARPLPHRLGQQPARQGLRGKNSFMRREVAAIHTFLPELGRTSASFVPGRQPENSPADPRTTD